MADTQTSRTDWMRAYIRTPPGILKIAEIVFSIIAFLCSVTQEWAWKGGGWVNFVAISGFIHAIIWFILHLLNFIPAIFVNYLIEFISYVVFAVFFLIAGIVAACGAAAVGPSVGAAAFFCFACMILWGVDSFFQFWEYRQGSSHSSAGQPKTEAQPDIDPSPHY